MYVHFTSVRNILTTFQVYANISVARRLYFDKNSRFIAEIFSHPKKRDYVSPSPFQDCSTYCEKSFCIKSNTYKQKNLKNFLLVAKNFIEIRI